MLSGRDVFHGGLHRRTLTHYPQNLLAREPDPPCQGMAGSRSGMSVKILPWPVVPAACAGNGPRGAAARVAVGTRRAPLFWFLRNRR